MNLTKLLPSGMYLKAELWTIIDNVIMGKASSQHESRL